MLSLYNHCLACMDEGSYMKRVCTQSNVDYAHSIHSHTTSYNSKFLVLERPCEVLAEKATTVMITLYEH